MSGAETARRRVVQRRIGGAESAALKRRRRNGPPHYIYMYEASVPQCHGAQLGAWCFTTAAYFAQSPRTNCMMFHYRSALKSRVYVNCPRSLQDFKPTSEKKLQIYPLIRRWGPWQTPGIGLFSVWKMGDVIYMMWFSKLCNTKL